MNNVVNQVAFLRTSREFPEDLGQLAIEVNKAYIDVANTVNARTIGVYPVNRPAITGNSYFFSNQRQQSKRQVYSFTTTADIELGFKIANISQFVCSYGQYVSGTSTYGLIFATTVAIGGQISFYFAVNAGSTTSDSIKFVVDGAAPALTSGTIIVEWLSAI